MFKKLLSCYIFTIAFLELITKTHLTFHDSSHGFISKNPRYFDDDLSHIHEGIASLRYLHKADSSANLNLRFEPELLDFQERPLGIPYSKTVTLFNIDNNKTIDLTSISGNTVHFHSSFFEDKKIPPNGNTSFKIVYLGRQEGHVESSLFLHTSSGFIKYNKSHMLYDKAGEQHYNTISAMHKSIRGSDANAALYWTTRMIVSGEDPKYIARRMVRAASEDIGNSDPQALPLAVATMQGCQLLGMPEADVLLAQCAIYLARAPKSREADSALARAKYLIKDCKGSQPAVPMHLRNAPTKLMKDLGYGELQEEEFSFMPPEYKDVNFFD